MLSSPGFFSLCSHPLSLQTGGWRLVSSLWHLTNPRGKTYKRLWHQFSHLDYLLDHCIPKFSLVSPLWKDHNFQPSFPCLTLKQGLAILDCQISEECLCSDRAETEKNKNQKNVVAAQGEETSKKQKTGRNILKDTRTFCNDERKTRTNKKEHP